MRWFADGETRCSAWLTEHFSLCVLVQLILIIGLAQALVVFRVVATGSLSESSWTLLKDNANIVAVILGAVLHYLTITIMTRVGLNPK